MCRIIASPNTTMDFKLINVPPSKAESIEYYNGRGILTEIQPGFMYLPLPETIKGSGKTQKQIKRIVLWTNAQHGYLGLNYHIWPRYKKIAAILRIFICSIFYPSKKAHFPRARLRGILA